MSKLDKVITVPMSIVRPKQPAVNRMLTSICYTQLESGCADTFVSCRASVNGNLGWFVGGRARSAVPGSDEGTPPIQHVATRVLGGAMMRKAPSRDSLGCARLPVISNDLDTPLVQGLVPCAMACPVPHAQGFQYRRDAGDISAAPPFYPSEPGLVCQESVCACGVIAVDGTSSHLHGRG